MVETMKKIAIIDDERNVAYNIAEIINIEFDEDVDLSIFSSSNEYYRFMESINYNITWDLLFMDYNLDEKIKGIELAKKLRETNDYKHLCFVSGENKYIFSTKLKFSGLDYYYLEKNSKLEEELIKTVEECLEL